MGPKTKRAKALVQSVYIECPHCGVDFAGEPVHMGTQIAWGGVQSCWSCGGAVSLPASPWRSR